MTGEFRRMMIALEDFPAGGAHSKPLEKHRSDANSAPVRLGSSGVGPGLGDAALGGAGGRRGGAEGVREGVGGEERPECGRAARGGLKVFGIGRKGPG